MTQNEEKKHLFTTHNYLLDLEFLRGLEKVTPKAQVKAFMSDLALVFYREAPAAIQGLERSIAKNETHKNIASGTLTLRSVCNAIGAMYMADLGLQIDKSLEKKDRPLTLALLEQLKDSYLVTRDQVQAYVAQLPPDA